MSLGSLVIANNLFGVLQSQTKDHCVIVDKEGKEHVVVSSVVKEVCNPHALALLLYEKVCAKTLR